MKKESFCEGWTLDGLPITLPHDAMIHREREEKAPSGSAGAYFPGGRYCYEKRFPRPDAEHVILEFEGVYKHARVFLNGKEAGGAPYGYIPFFVEADSLLVPGENILRVECDNEDQPDSRWYSGAGIYRPVWLWTGDGEVLRPESLRITTLSIHPVRIRVEAEVEASFSILYQGKEVAKGKGRDVTLDIPEARLWSEETPELYTCQANTSSDSYHVPFGIRLITRDKEGLKINDRKVLLRGGCLHQDSGILGAATYDEIQWRQVRRLKEAGFNAIRSAHNPANRALLDACDALGVYVMDEAWDMWFLPKSKHDYAKKWREHYLSDLESMVSRDYNHPSVILYSIGNEVSEPAKQEGIEKVKEMVSFLHQKDPGRLVTAGFNLMIIKSASKGKGIYKEDGSGRDDSSDQKMSSMNSTMLNLITNLVGTG
ncbi:MAG: glycoside hydrolase family 2 protein, partial [Blautia sp.]|nr:glycoside hydrolase family 2 protein [Blautia sp.]